MFAFINRLHDNDVTEVNWPNDPTQCIMVDDNQRLGLITTSWQKDEQVRLFVSYKDKLIHVLVTWPNGSAEHSSNGHFSALHTFSFS